MKIVHCALIVTCGLCLFVWSVFVCVWIVNLITLIASSAQNQKQPIRADDVKHIIITITTTATKEKKKSNQSKMNEWHALQQ